MTSALAERRLLAGVGRGDGHIYPSSGSVSFGAGQSGLGILDGDLVIAGIEIDDRVTPLHHLVLFHVHLGDVAGDARTDLDEVTIDLRVIGVFGVCGAPPDAEGDEYHDNESDDDNTPAAGPRRFDLGLCSRFIWFGCWVWIRHVHFPPRYFL